MTAISATTGTSYAVTDYTSGQTELNSSVQNTENISQGSTQNGTNTSSTSSESSDFATVYNNTLLDEQAQSDVATGTSVDLEGIGASPVSNTSVMPGMVTVPGMDLGFGSSSVEQALLGATSSTNSSNDQMALAMMMMMMMSMQGGMGGMGGMGGDTSMMQMMISALLPQLENSSQNLNNNQQTGIPFMNFANNSQFGIETNMAGGMATSSVAGFGSAILPLNVGMAATPVITSNIHNRCPARYRAVLDQFQVESAERYRPGRDGFTYCNIFVLDVVRAMGAHIPHLGAINMCNWLGTTGRQHGWREVDAMTAQAHANMGRPAVTSAGSIGHVQMVVPSRTPFNPERGVSIAQAGRINTNYAPISTIYGGNTLLTRIRYFVHD